MADFPRSAVPIFLIAGALAVDLAFLVRLPVVRALAGSLAATVLLDQVLRQQAKMFFTPPQVSLPTMLAGGALLAALWLAGEWALVRHRLRAQDMEAVVSATAAP